MSMSTARRSLRTAWSDAKVLSCADGSIRIEPKYRRKYRKPGVITRMYLARMVADCLNIRGKK